MSLYFFIGNGVGVTLEEMGHADAIQAYYTQHYLPRFLEQIRLKTTFAPIGAFYDDFDATYDFWEVLYSYRNAGVKGSFNGEIKQYPGGPRIIDGRMSFTFHDQFKDPIEIAQLATNVRNAIPFLTPIREVDLWTWLRTAADLWQDPYPITGHWEMNYREIIP